MTSAWKPIPRPRGPVSSTDPVRLTIEARWSGPSRSVFRLPEADHVPAKARDSPGASAPSGPLAGPEHAIQRTRAAGTSHHGAPPASLERHRSIPCPDPPATVLNAPLISRRSCQSALAVNLELPSYRDHASAKARSRGVSGFDLHSARARSIPSAASRSSQVVPWSGALRHPPPPQLGHQASPLHENGTRCSRPRMGRWCAGGLERGTRPAHTSLGLGVTPSPWCRAPQSLRAPARRPRIR